MKTKIFSTLLIAFATCVAFGDPAEPNITINGLTFQRAGKGAIRNDQLLITNIVGTLKTGLDTNELDGASVADIRISNSGRDVTIKAKNPDKDDSLKGMVLIRMPEDTVDQSTLNYTNAADTIVIDGKTYRMMPLMSAKAIDKKLARLLPRWTKTAAEALPTIPVTSTTVTPNDLINGYEAIRTFLINNSVDAITTETAAPATGPAIIGGAPKVPPATITYLGNTFTKCSDGKYRVNPEAGIYLTLNSSDQPTGLGGYPNYWDVGIDSVLTNKNASLATEVTLNRVTDASTDIIYYVFSPPLFSYFPKVRYRNIKFSDYFASKTPQIFSCPIRNDFIRNSSSDPYTTLPVTFRSESVTAVNVICNNYGLDVDGEAFDGRFGWYMSGTTTLPGNCIFTVVVSGNTYQCWEFYNDYVRNIVFVNPKY